MTINVDQLIADIKNVSTRIINSDISTVRGFSDRQVKAIALQAAYVAGGITTGEITDETRDFFLDGIEDMATNFVKTLRGIVSITIEKIWNAVIGVIWQAIASATGIVIPIHSMS
ncbi:hypothetical protein G9409_08280 [Chlorobium sp. BLA1]|uniref:hypothetical protein n=1 Tax=Candidatus Chlorobium masyuteum TaxID=2716876 RepID=UPI00141E4FBB|nr:hypothetical protein [Candidatus Chlorobium masyuteum]NHQ60583.1 hypothetical protein [Candidatus Chlorobium masyuteum]